MSVWAPCLICRQMDSATYHEWWYRRRYNYYAVSDQIFANLSDLEVLPSGGANLTRGLC
jgi:hypothetical protein